MGRDTDPLYCLEEEDRKLAIGKEVIVHWNHNGYSCRGKAKVAALRDKRVAVVLTEPAGHNGECPAGQEILVPRYSDYAHWSSNNCVRAAPKNEFRHKDFL